MPLLYWAFATAALALAFAAAAFDPTMLGEFFYHPRALALVHLVTLGWITCSIIGALYLVGPVALRTVIPATRLDHLAFTCVVVGVVGMVGHFWTGLYNGMAWAAATLLIGLTLVTYRIARPLIAAPIPAAIKLHVALAFGNLLAAGVLGALIGLEKQSVVRLPGFVLSNVFAHAHLAALGWATMMVMGIGYRLLPMLIPAAMPGSRWLLATALLLESGVVGLFIALIVDSPWVWLFAGLIVIALAVFGGQVVRMLVNRRPSPRGLVRPDPALVHIIQAMLYLALSVGIGLVLLASPASTTKLQLVFVYGVFGLLGFLAQLIVGVGARLLPLTAWMQAFVRSGFRTPVYSQYQMLDRRLQWLALGLWSIGVPTLAATLYMNSRRGVSYAAAMLFLATLVETINRVRIVWAARQLGPGTVPTCDE